MSLSVGSRGRPETPADADADVAALRLGARMARFQQGLAGVLAALCLGAIVGAVATGDAAFAFAFTPVALVAMLFLMTASVVIRLLVSIRSAMGPLPQD